MLCKVVTIKYINPCFNHQCYISAPWSFASHETISKNPPGSACYYFQILGDDIDGTSEREREREGGGGGEKEEEEEEEERGRELGQVCIPYNCVRSNLCQWHLLSKQHIQNEERIIIHQHYSKLNR